MLAAPPSQEETRHKVRLMFGNGLRAKVWNDFTKRFGVDKIVEFLEMSVIRTPLNVKNLSDAIESHASST